MAPVEPSARSGLRTGFTTGACAAAAAQAAARCLAHGRPLDAIDTELPNRQRVRFPLARCERAGSAWRVGVVKDAGDDPDCTHGAELIAVVRDARGSGVVVVAGEGVASVTKPGLGLELGAPAITPVPHRSLVRLVTGELGPERNVEVLLEVPGGEAMARQTLNARLGLVGGISILGTTGIVKPYSTAAYRASVVRAIELAVAVGHAIVWLTTGGKSEQQAMALWPGVGEEAFIQVGDFVGTGVRHARRAGCRRAIVVGMIGKLSKMAAGSAMTHAAGSAVDMRMLADLARREGCDDGLCSALAAANTARHVLDLCRAAGRLDVASRICSEALEHLSAHAGAGLEIGVVMLDFDGQPIGSAPADVLPSAWFGGAL